MAPFPSLKRVQASVFLISAALISYQILLVKMFSIQYWYHFAYLIISIALLGFGASGTFIVLKKRFLKNHFSSVLFFCPLLFVVSIWTNIYLNLAIAFNPLMIIWHKYEIIRLLILSLSIFIPFFLGALCIGVSLIALPDHIPTIYCANLTGSGMGGLIILLTFFQISPYDMMFIISLITLCAALGGSTNRVRQRIICAAGVTLIVLYAFVFRFSPLAMSAFKDLAQAENLMAAKKETEVFGPLGLVTVLESPAYHYFPDLSLNCPYPLPRQKGIFLDGNTVGAINAFTGNLNDVRFMDYRTNSLAYKLLHHPDVLIIGGGSGTELLSAQYHAANSIAVVEMNADIVHLMQGPYGPFSGSIYNAGNTRVVIEEGRGYLQKTQGRFDLIQFGFLESMGTASAGVYSLNENYLYTTEAIRLCLDRLRPGGILSISTWVKNPPRDTIKLFAMAIEAIERQGKTSPAQSIIMIRSWQAATLLVKNGIFQNKDIEAIRAFCKSRIFDIAYSPGVEEKETNTLNRMEGDIFYSAAMSLLSRERENFYEMYPFYVKPSTDDRPFFSHFFKIGMMKDYFSSSDRALIPFLDWGYILVWITAGILFLLGMIFILAPLPFVLPHRKGLISIIMYFGSIGMAYIFLEISFLQQFIRYLYDPIFSASVVIGSFLVYSGIGSLIAGKFVPVKSKHLFLSVLVISTAGIGFLTADEWLQNVLSRFPLWLRMLSCSMLIAPLAIPMGIFFPSGLSTLTAKQEGLIPWAWSINGFFSVMGSSATVLIAIAWGFKSIIVMAMLLYVLSACMFIRLRTKGSTC